MPLMEFATVAVLVDYSLHIALPLLLNGLNPDRFAQVPWLAGMAALAYGGNALEEVLFRGFLQGHLETLTSLWRAAWGSAVAFAACHAFLTYAVTGIGWPLLAFNLAEGVACAFVRIRYGLIRAILTHGTAISKIAVPMATT